MFDNYKKDIDKKDFIYYKNKEPDFDDIVLIIVGTIFGSIIAIIIFLSIIR